jgi:hypothetical protein
VTFPSLILIDTVSWNFQRQKVYQLKNKQTHKNLSPFTHIKIIIFITDEERVTLK